MIPRRALLLAAAAAVPGAAARGADPARIAVVFFGTAAVHAGQLAAFRRGLARFGLAEGAGVVLEIYHLDGDVARLPALAEAIVRSAPRIIVAAPVRTVAELRRATTTIPIVMATGADPVGGGVAASLARPGGNVTGVSNQGADLVEKQLGVLREALPAANSVLAVRAPGERAMLGDAMQAAFDRGAQRLGLVAATVEFRGPADLVRLRAAIGERRPNALFVWSDPVAQVHRQALVALAAELGVPTIGSFRTMAEAGALASYGSNAIDNWERAAWFVDRILKGANPAELPIEQPTRFEFVINLKTAKALGIEIPQNVLAGADEVIE